MAALLGNMQRPPGQQQPQAAYGGGMQAPMQGPVQGGGLYQQPMQGGLGAGPMQGQVWRGGQPMQQAPIPPGGAGYPQMSPDAMQNMMGQISRLQAQQPGVFQGTAGGPRPMPSFGAPAGGGGAGKGAAAQNPQLKNAIAQLPGGPPMGGPMGPMRRRPGQGMLPQNPQMRQGR